MVVNIASNEVTVVVEARMEEGVVDGNPPAVVATLETTSGSNRSFFPVAVASAELVESASTPTVIPVLEEDGRLDRPDLLSATVYKGSSTKVGLSLFNSEGVGVMVGSLDQEGLFAAAPFERGDRVMSVNSENCEDLDAQSVARLIKDALNMVTVIVRAPNGRAELVSSMIRKKSPTELVGVALKCHRGKILIASIAEDRMFAHSLLNVGDRVLFINSIKMTADMDAAAAATLIQSSPDFVTIETKTEHGTGVVMAASKGPEVLSSDEAERSEHARNAERTRQQNKGGACCLLLMIIVIIVIISMAKNDDNESCSYLACRVCGYGCFNSTSSEYNYCCDTRSVFTCTGICPDH